MSLASLLSNELTNHLLMAAEQCSAFGVTMRLQQGIDAIHLFEHEGNLGSFLRPGKHVDGLEFVGVQFRSVETGLRGKLYHPGKQQVRNNASIGKYFADDIPRIFDDGCQQVKRGQVIAAAHRSNLLGAAEDDLALVTAVYHRIIMRKIPRFHISGHEAAKPVGIGLIGEKQIAQDLVFFLKGHGRVLAHALLLIYSANHLSQADDAEKQMLFFDITVAARYRSPGGDLPGH